MGRDNVKMSANTDRIRIDGGVVVAYQAGGHRVLTDGVVVVEGNEIVHVGKSFDGHVDRVIDARNAIVTPGFINTHTHLSESPLDKSFVEDRGRRQFYYSGLFEMLPARSAGIDHDGRTACVDYSMGELLRTGTTTVMEIGGIGDYTADAAQKAGLRAYIANSYRSGRWFTPDGKRVAYSWDEEAGRQNFRKAVEFIERVDGRANGRIKGFLSPSQVDTCTEELLRLSKQASDEMQVPLALHTSQSTNEFQEMIHRNGCTPVEWLHEIGFLGEWNILGHVIIIAGSSWAQYAGDDLALLADAGASVAHCVWVFARRGIAMESFPRYLAAGVNMTLGTDTAPQSMIEALRWTAVLGKIQARETQVSTAADVFNAATLGGANMLHRDDLGRIAPGAKADVLIWRRDSLFMSPLRDAIKNIVYNATPEDLRMVMVDGRVVLDDGQPLFVDQQAANLAVQHAGDRMWSELQAGDWAKRTADELAPQSFAAWE
jgi:cytosine/adenosine deaminase-related metal-dependent hydrolase